MVFSRRFWMICILSAARICYAQQDSSKIKSLDAVIIRAYEQNQRLKDIPAAVNYVGVNTLNRFGNSSVISAINSTPGVRMEERSPGSYRFNIRGSSLRSPFGVRNVKVYFNDIPITDPGGITYVNQLGYYNFRTIEVIKGPGSSLYGAGTGGVLLIESISDDMQPGASAEYSRRSFGSNNIYGSVTTRTPTGNSFTHTAYQHQTSQGYRAHSRLRRDVFSWNGRFTMGSSFLKVSFLYGDLYYQTPGALTGAEYNIDPSAARPTVGTIPGAEAAKAAIYQKQFIAGASLTQPIASHLENRTVLYGMFTDLKNPTIQNYSHNTEPHAGSRSIFIYKLKKGETNLIIHLGVEIQKGFASVSIHKNVNGNADSLRSHDEINNLQSMLFTQAAFQSKGWSVIAGASLNFLKVKFERFSPASSGKQEREFNNNLAPRFSIMKKLGFVNIYSGVSKGFSSPTTSELLPTGGAINLDLKAENGINYDIGFKGTVHRLYFDINAFTFSLTNTIVLRRTAAGGDYYINAGKTKQYGVESSFNYPLTGIKLSDKSSLWLSHTWHNFHYKTFTQLTNDYSGNQLPSVAPHVIAAGVDIYLINGMLAAFNYYYSARIPLNDANSDYASSYHLIGAQLGYEKMLHQVGFKIVAGIENLLGQKYSLGNDINGFGGRYFNAAAGRNYFVSASLNFCGHPQMSSRHQRLSKQ